MLQRDQRASLHTLLRESKLVRSRHFDRLERQARGDRVPLTQKAVELRLISERQAADIVARHLGVPRVNLGSAVFNARVTPAVPPHLARYFGVLPLSRCGDTVTLAVCTPDCDDVLEQLKPLTGYTFEPVAAERSELVRAIVRTYRKWPAEPRTHEQRGAWPAALITTPVAEVEVAVAPLSELPLSSLLFRDMGPIECCSSHFDAAVECYHQGHALLVAAYLAFSQHRPLVLSPDMVWLSIAQGFAHHLRADAVGRPLMALGDAPVLHLDKEGFDPRSFEAWLEQFDDLSQQIQQHAGAERLALMQGEFSGSGPVERAAAEMALMEGSQTYFTASSMCICGIPSVTLEGTVEDWIKLQQRVDGLGAAADLGWWLDSLRPVLQQFVRTAQGDVDTAFWRDLYQQHAPDTEGYGGPHERFTGWIGYLVPYTHSKRNPLLSNRDEPVYLSQFPPALSSMSVRWADQTFHCTAGLVALQQDLATRALRPTVGWVALKAAT